METEFNSLRQKIDVATSCTNCRTTMKNNNNNNNNGNSGLMSSVYENHSSNNNIVGSAKNGGGVDERFAPVPAPRSTKTVFLLFVRKFNVFFIEGFKQLFTTKSLKRRNPVGGSGFTIGSSRTPQRGEWPPRADPLDWLD